MSRLGRTVGKVNSASANHNLLFTIHYFLRFRSVIAVASDDAVFDDFALLIDDPQGITLVIHKVNLQFVELPVLRRVRGNETQAILQAKLPVDLLENSRQFAFEAGKVSLAT